MILLDTSVWIEYLKRKEPIFPILKTHLENGEILAAECVFAELLQGVKNKREERIILQYWSNLPHFSMEGVFLEAGLKSNQQKWMNKGIGLIDAAILIYAGKHECRIWTLDKKMLRVMKKSEMFLPELP